MPIRNLKPIMKRPINKNITAYLIFTSLLYIAMSLLIAYVFAHGDTQSPFWSELPKGLLISSGLWILAAYQLYHFKKK